MSDVKYLKLRFAGDEIDLPQNKNIPISLSYKIEDTDDFRQKKSGEALNITVPATINNSGKLNTLFNPDVENYSPNGNYDQPQEAVIIANGNELMKGKGFVLSARKKGGKAKDFTLKIFGDNSDWIIDNKELTLHDVISSLTHTFDKSTIEASWLHDGTVESEFYVYAPVRQRNAFGTPNSSDTPDSIFRPINATPSLFVYWLIYWGFQKAGYKIKSEFFDTDYFRRRTMPWTWGNFLYIDSNELDALKFNAIWVPSNLDINIGNNSATEELGSDGGSMSNDISQGGFDNNNTYSWVGTNEMVWEYPISFSSFGNIIVGFQLDIAVSYRLTLNSNFILFAEFYEDIGSGWSLTSSQTIVSDSAPVFGSTGTISSFNSIFYESNGLGLPPGSKVKCEVKCSYNASTTGNVEVQAGSIANLGIATYKNTYFKIPLGGTIDFKKHNGLKNYKWIDLLRGIVDDFNLQLNTDSFKKEVVIEPTHDYSLTNNLAQNTNNGFYNGEIVDWTNKEDLLKESELILYQDFEKEFSIKLQDDSNDGILKLLQDRYKSSSDKSTYCFPSRFKKGINSTENRFFSGVVHYNHESWKEITGVAPQFICLIPENIANTSNPSSQNTFKPKLAHYKGLVDRNTYGGWNWDGDTSKDLPFMFAVNYKPGGESDPILTYNDQNINGVIGYGLFKRFFWQRFAIMRHGRLYSSNFLLNNSDVRDRLHREFKQIGINKYQLIEINNYLPLIEESTNSKLWRWHPVTEYENKNTYPSVDSIINGSPIINSPDFRYFKNLALISDIPI